MGFIPSSSTIQLYAYFTEYARDALIKGNKNVYEITQFSLHDEDINYQISKEIIGLTQNQKLIYNTPKSGFIPDLTGDGDTCVKSNKSIISLEKNILKGSIQITSELTATVTQVCSSNNPDHVSVNVTNPQGGTGNGYQWRVIPVYSNNNIIPNTDPVYQIFTTNQYLINKNIGQPFEFITNNPSNNSIIKYQIYLKDNTSNERLIFTTNLECIPPVLEENLIFNITNDFIAIGQLGGSQPIPPPSGPISVEPPKFREVDFTMQNDSNTPISLQSLNEAFFKIEKVDSNSFSQNYNDVWDYINVFISDSDNLSIETQIDNNLLFSFSDDINGVSTSNQNNSIYTKRLTFKFKRLNKGTVKPFNSTSTFPLEQTGNVKLRIISDDENILFDNQVIEFGFKINLWG